MKPLDLSDNAPWKQRYRAASINWSRLASQDPTRGLVCTDQDGAYQLYAWDVPTGRLRKLTDQPAGVVNGLLTADGQAVYYHKDERGNEVGYFMRVPFEGGGEENATPALDPYPAWAMASSKNGSHLGFIRSGDDGFKLYLIEKGQPAQLFYHQRKHVIYGPFFSAAGDLVGIENTSRSGTIETTVVVFDTHSGEQIGELWDGDDVTVALQSFSPVMGDPRLLSYTSQSGYARPVIWNPRTDERVDLAVDELKGEIFPWGWSADASKVLLCQLYQARHQIYTYEVATHRLTKLDHPEGVFSAGYFTSEGEIWVNWENAVAPSRVVALDGQTGQLKRTVLDAGDIPKARPWRSVNFAGAQGDMIQAWVATPEGDGPFPTILHTHGGPTAVMSENFAPNAQAWLDHGFAFMSVNYHGSTTFGKAFEKSIWGNLGDLEVDDMAAAYEWLVETGIADPQAVLLTGRSYGGYLTLQALGRRPELWAGGMAMVAIADWGLMYEDQIETLRSYQRALFGGAPHEVPEETRKSSPITYAKAIQAPILVIQGENDTRCPARQMHVFEDKLNKLGKSIEVQWYSAGHGSWVQEEAIKHQEMMMRFAYRVLG